MARTLNPFRCGRTGLPVNLVVMVKCLAIALLLTRHVQQLPTPFLPFVPGLDLIPPVLFQRVLQTVFIASALALLFNCYVRTSAFLLGFTMLLGVVASKAYYGNNKTFCGLLLVLTALQQPGAEPWLLRFQLVIVYFGAGLNKLIDPDWRSGLFFNFWAGTKIRHPLYIALDSILPAMFLPKLMSWFSIVTELGLSVAFLIKRLFPIGIWLSLVFHAGMLLFTRGDTFNMFFYAMSASMLIFANWPTQPIQVIFDGDCGFCTRVKEWYERIDLEEMFRWAPYQSGIGRTYGIPESETSMRLYLINGAKVYSGFRACRMLLLCNPVFYLLTYVALAAPGPGPSAFRNALVVTLLVLFSPLFNPLGEALYRLIASNRHRIPIAGSCQIK